MAVLMPTTDGPEPSSDPAIRDVLVVDDSRLQRRILSLSLRKWGFRVAEAESGAEALVCCRASPPDLVLSDWMMPEMDGLEFCKQFRELGLDNYSYFILLTTKSEKQEIAQGLDAGADDFLTKPVNGHELRARINAGDRIVRMQRELTGKNELIAATLKEMQRLHDEIDRDLMQAKKIQESLLPELSRDLGTSRISLLLKPCGHVGGDLVGMFSPDADQLGFYNIDVSGHGITSALMSARVAGYLSSDFPDRNLAMIREGNSITLRPPEEVARLLNDLLAAEAGIVEYFTMVLGAINLKTGRMQMVQAGHPHPLVLRASGRREFLGSGGPPVGLVADMPYEGFETTLEPGDRVLLYSDGFTECVMQDGEMLESDGLLDLLGQLDPSRTGSDLLDDLYWLLTSRRSSAIGLDDDVSAVLLEYGGPAGECDRF